MPEKSGNERLVIKIPDVVDDDELSKLKKEQKNLKSKNKKEGQHEL